MSGFSAVVRVDSGHPMGSGHLMRCLTLADELRQRGAHVTFICRVHRDHSIDRLENAGYAVHRLSSVTDVNSIDAGTWLGASQARDASESLAALAGKRFDWLIVDHYAIDSHWERLMRAAAERVLVIDDLSNRPHDADLLLDQNYATAGQENRYDRFVPRGCRTLLGPRFALLQPLYRQLRRVAPMRGGAAARVFVFFGANDVERTVITVLRALQSAALRHLRVDLVPGSDPSIVAEARNLANRETVTIHEKLPGLGGLIVRADFAIGAGGSTTWERACLGLPSLVAIVAENQSQITRALAADQFIAFAGQAKDMSEQDWIECIAELARSPARLAALESRSLGLTDGFGAARVATAMMNFVGREISMRRANAFDEPLLLEWANDPEVRNAAFHKERITAEGHHRWFIDRLADPNCTILIGEDESGMPLGQVRFDCERNSSEAAIDISVDRDVRRSGVGLLLLLAAVKHWRAATPGKTAIAEVLIDNLRSKRLFEAAGFAPMGARRPETVAFRLPPEH